MAKAGSEPKNAPNKAPQALPEAAKSHAVSLNEPSKLATEHSNNVSEHSMFKNDDLKVNNESLSLKYKRT